ncbi:MAG TPA: cellulose synthase subunit BcsC-related outer membrane protein, partial [Terracidiphilus sp.]|nr:cellulose synthase subunit BcsC-related outer membrane protein [Terracidiphilus sp.]
ALTRFQYASELRPRDPAVLDALGRTWIQMKQPEKAIPLFEQAVKLNENRPDAWIDWFGTLAQTGRSREVVADQPYIPPAVSTQLATNPEYIAILAVSELETGNEESFRQLLEQLHSSTDTTKRVNGQLRLASLILNSNPRDAAREALDIIRLSPDNIEAWKLVVIAEHLANRDTMAQTAIDRMPQQVYAAAQKDTNFAITLAAVQQSLHHYGDATDVLESARARAAEDPVALRTIDSQLASLSLQQGDPNKAAQGYSAIVQEQPDNSDAWAGLISALHQSNQDRLARAQMDLMPPSVAEHLQLDPGYLQVAASVYTETHELQRALTALATVRNYYRDREQQIPYSVEAQRAWALIAIGDDNDVANTLVQLSHRSDLKPVEQRQNRMLWAAWSVRKALQEEKHGNPQRAIAILEMASQAYPDSVDIRRALAGTYVRTGNAKSALALYEGIDWYSAGKEDFLGAISAASASRDFTQGRQWVANALEHFPDDPQVLTAAAEFESSAGDMRMAKQYWHDVLNVPAQKLEQQLSQSSNGSSSISASDALARMLAPHVRSGDESASEAAAPPPSGSSDETDDVMAMLPASGGATSSRAIVPDTPPSGQSSQQNASPWLVEKARSKGASYQPMAYSDESAAPSHGEQSAWRPASDQSVPAPLAPASSYVSPRPSSRVTADRSVYNDELPDVTQPAPLPAQAPERAALLRTVALQNQIPQSGADSGHGWSSSQSSSDAASSFTGYSTAGASQQFANADSSAPQAGPPNNFLIRTNPDARRASDELQNLSSELSPWVGGSVRIVGRSGSPGFDQLTRSEIGIEGSSVLGDSARVTVITKPTFLTSGTPVANSEGVLNTPYNFGQSGAPLLNQPHFQSGVGGELQIATPFLSGSVGFTPSTFYVSNKLGSVDLHPERTPFHLGVFRESITETMLSYAGERDPVTGAIWGGVVATGAEGGISKGTVQSGFYTDFSAAKITGLNVNENQRLEGSTGAYWTFFTNAYGALKIGANVSGEHFDQNQRYFTYGQGGYFSPDTYLLINAPFTWTGRSNRLAYTISGSLGMQSFNEDPALAGSISTNAPTAQTVIGANYSLSGNFAYKLDEHWYIGTFFNVNNTSNYQERSAGFSVRYMKLPQVQSLIGPTGLFDNQAPRPLIIP